ncbi:MAG: TlpA family protein disulfide reductase, partial [Verrucomicrobiales bacterium]
APCVTFLPELAKIHRRYDSKGLEVIGLETGGSEAEAIAKLCKSSRVAYPVMKGGGVPVRINRIPHACVFGTDGHLVWEGPPHKPEFLRSIKEALRKVGATGDSATMTVHDRNVSKPLVGLRQWTNADGKTMHAALLRLEGTKAVFQIEGRKVPYDISGLSDEDQNLVQKLKASATDS